MRWARRWGLGPAVAAATLAMGLLPAARAQTVPGPPPTAVAPHPDSIKRPPPTFVVDTARHVIVVTPAPTDVVTHQLGLRIGAAILVLSLPTLLLYNVRSR